jgi:ABC-type sugar transport system ATPase subunit
MALIGPSGCGKTTTLRLLAGLEEPTAGTIRLGQNDITTVAPVERNIAMMFQSDALYPQMSVRGNLSFGLSVRKGVWNRLFGSSAGDANKSPIRFKERVEHVAKKLGIEMLLDRKPHQLSGGERQRVALGRAMVREPAAFLLDEPLSRLDARLADELRVELRNVFRELGKPVLYVTHDQREAMSLADRLAVMDRGKILQVGTPMEVYQRPANLFVANFVGAVPVNVVPFADCSEWLMALAKKWAPGGTDSIGFRSEHIEIGKGSNESINFRANARDVEWLGDHGLVHMEADEFGSAELIARCEADASIQVGDEFDAFVQRRQLMWFDSAGTRIEPN